MSVIVSLIEKHKGNPPELADRVADELKTFRSYDLSEKTRFPKPVMDLVAKALDKKKIP